ncbi:MAG: DJ-1/PfpI family protein [Magnetococcales bacterium]|nr:DJ-1/PfpI family protein [Magnetococcales bacterium]
MSDQPLRGKKIAILVETEYVPSEIETYRTRFAAYGAEVHLMSRLWGNPKVTFVSDVDQIGKPVETLEVAIDFQSVAVEDYAAIIQAANYTSVRLRWLDDKDYPHPPPPRANDARCAPAVQFIYRAMRNPRIIKGFPCHALWILSAIPETLAGRHVTCNRVLIPDVVNAGGVYVAAPNGVHVDADLVTDDSAARSPEFVDAIRDQILAMEAGSVTPALTVANAATTPDTPAVANPAPRRILVVLSEWGYWGEELVGPLEEFRRVGYTVDFCTPTGKRPNAIGVSMDPNFIDPPLARAVTSHAMAAKVRAIDDATSPEGQCLNRPISLADWFPERPYWSHPQLVRALEMYNLLRARAEEKVGDYDALMLVGGSGPIVDMVNNQRLHDLILAFHKAGKPIAAQCYGVACLAFARNIEDRRSLLWGKRVTGHCLEYDYKDGTGFMAGRNTPLDFNMGPPPYPLEYILRDATGPEGAYIGNFGHPTSVIVDYPFITGRSTPDATLTGRKLVEVLDGNPPLRRWGW